MRGAEEGRDQFIGAVMVCWFEVRREETLTRTGFKALLVVAMLATFARGLADDPSPRPYPGTGMFLMLSDIHFDPYTDPAIIKALGAIPKAGCPDPTTAAPSRYGSDTNGPLLRSTLAAAVTTAAENRFHYDYVLLTGDFLAHHFDFLYSRCVEGGHAGYPNFVTHTVAYVHRMIAQALPGVPVIAALGNNDSDLGDYTEPSDDFLRSVGSDWSSAWGSVDSEPKVAALASFGKAGYYAVPHPTVPKSELVVVNSTLWAVQNSKACTDADPDPGGQFQWLKQVLERTRRAGGGATLIWHIPPGIDPLRSSGSTPRSFWTEPCTERLMAELADYRGVVREIYAGHIHRDDFRIFRDPEGRPFLPIHVVPAVSPVYLNNPAAEIGWYDKSTGELRDYAPLYLDLKATSPSWNVEYVFTRAYGFARPDLASLLELTRAIHQGDSESGVGGKYARAYGAGVTWLMRPDQWPVFTCAQTEITPSSFVMCEHAGARR